MRIAKKYAAETLEQSRRIVGSRRGRSLGSPANYFRQTPAIGYAGWVGKANLGDEALYDAFVRLFPDDRLISINFPLPIELTAHAALLRGGRLFRGVLLGGGTLIFHKSYAYSMQKAQSRGLPTAVFGTGVIDTEFWSERLGSLGYDPVKPLWQDVLGRANYIGVRGPDSYAKLEELGVTGHEVIGDPALSVCQEIQGRTITPKLKISMNLGNIGPAWGSQDQVEEGYGRAATRMLEDGHAVDFFAFHRSDAVRAEQVVSDYALRVGEVWQEFRDTDRALDKLNKYDVVIAQKLHGSVLAIGLGIPCVSVAYEPKCIDFMKSVGMEDCVIRADRLTHERLVDKVYEVADRYDELRAVIRERVTHWQACQRAAAAKVMQVFRAGHSGG